VPYRVFGELHLIATELVRMLVYLYYRRQRRIRQENSRKLVKMLKASAPPGSLVLSVTTVQRLRSRSNSQSGSTAFNHPSFSLNRTTSFNNGSSSSSTAGAMGNITSSPWSPMVEQSLSLRSSFSPTVVTDARSSTMPLVANEKTCVSFFLEKSRDRSAESDLRGRRFVGDIYVDFLLACHQNPNDEDINDNDIESSATLDSDGSLLLLVAQLGYNELLALLLGFGADTEVSRQVCGLLLWHCWHWLIA
jgi:hypothetical protein